MKNKNLMYISAESVSEGHCDKLLDCAGSTLLDNYIAFDPYSQVGIDALAVGNKFFIGGEVRSLAFDDIDAEQIVRNTIAKSGYTERNIPLNDVDADVNILIQPQSPEINHGVVDHDNNEIGAGDQGTIWAGAVKDAPGDIPLAFFIANNILLELKNIRNNEPGIMDYLRPDAKSQVTIGYDDSGEPVEISNIVVSTSHSHFLDNDDEMLAVIRRDIKNVVIPRVKNKLSENIQKLFNDEIEYLINPSGTFTIYGSISDSAEIGRKCVVDICSGGTIIKGNDKKAAIITLNFGGGCILAKNPTKSDMSAVLMARYVSKNAINAGISDAMNIEVSYAIGHTKPVNVLVNTFGTSHISLNDREISNKLTELFDFTPYGIIKTLNLNQPIYEECGTYGIFGRKNEIVHKKFTDRCGNVKEMDVELFTWEKLDAVDKIKEAFNL